MLAKACAASLPSAIGARSRTESGIITKPGAVFRQCPRRAGTRDQRPWIAADRLPRLCRDGPVSAAAGLREQGGAQIVSGDVDWRKGEGIGHQSRGRRHRHIGAQRQGQERGKGKLAQRDDESGEQAHRQGARDAAAIEMPERRMGKPMGDRPEQSAAED